MVILVSDLFSCRMKRDLPVRLMLSKFAGCVHLVLTAGVQPYQIYTTWLKSICNLVLAPTGKLLLGLDEPRSQVSLIFTFRFALFFSDLPIPCIIVNTNGDIKTGEALDQG